MLHVLTEDVRRGAEMSALLVRDELRERGFSARAVALTSVPEQPRLDVEVLGPGRLHRRTLGALRRLGRAVDVVVAHGSSTLPACAIALAGTGTPFVYANIGDLSYWAGSGHRHWRTAALLRRPAAVAARSERSAETLVRDFGVPAARVRVVPNGRPAQRFRPAGAEGRARARARLGLDGGPVVGWVGSLTTEKRPDLAVRAVSHLVSAHLVMAGDGPLRAEVESLAARVAQGRVHLLGAVDDVAPVYALMDLLLLTSDSEGLPGVLIEAGLAGVAAVATKVGFVDEMVVDGVTGLLVPPGSPQALAEALGRALRDARALGERAAGHCLDTYSMTAVGDRWEELLVEVLARTGGQAA